MVEKNKPNRSQKIRDYMEKHPDKTPKEIADALNENVGLVHTVIKDLRKKDQKKNGVASKPKASETPVATTVMANANGDAEHILAAAKLIKSCGSVQKARDMVKAAEAVAAVFQA